VKKLLIALLVLIALLIAADRIGVAVTNSVAASQLQKNLDLDDKPKVHVQGIPFLTQVVNGVYDDVHVQASDLDAGDLDGISVDLRLHGIHLGVSDALSQNLDEVPIDHVDGTVRVPLASLAAASGVDGLTLTGDGDQVELRASVSVAGKTLDVDATGSVRLAGRELTVTVESVQVAGGPLDSAISGAVTKQLSFTVDTGGLPFDARLTSVRVDGGALTADASADDVVIRDGELVPRSG
jgi:hypothetical protein